MKPCSDVDEKTRSKFIGRVHKNTAVSTLRFSLSTANKTLAKGNVGSNARKSVRKIEAMFRFAIVFVRCMSIGLMYSTIPH